MLAWFGVLVAGILFAFTAPTVDLVVRSTVSIIFVLNVDAIIFLVCVFVSVYVSVLGVCRWLFYFSLAQTLARSLSLSVCACVCACVCAFLCACAAFFYAANVRLRFRLVYWFTLV